MTAPGATVRNSPAARGCVATRPLLAFVAAKRRFTVHLRPEDVREALGLHVDLDEVTAALVALEGWGNLGSDPDTSRVTTVEDFHRARYLYQLTREGEAAESYDVVESIAASYDVSPEQVRIAWTLSLGEHVLAIPGTGDVGHLEQNVVAASLRLAEADLSALAALTPR